MTASTTGGLAAEVAEYVDSQAAAPLPMVEVAVTDAGGKPVVRGRVLTAKQAAAVGAIARRHAAAVDVSVIADPANRMEAGWLTLTGRAIEVWRDPNSIGEDRARQTEYIAGDGPLRLLGRLPEALLVQGPDLTVGWVEEAAVTEADPESSRAEWQRRLRAVPDAAVQPDSAVQHSDDALDRLLAAGRGALGTPYRWGGTTGSGYDCSGLVQRLFSGTTGVLLPKHTGDQRHVGARLTAGEPRAGDLLFATPIGEKVGHVMMLTSPATVLHACRTEESVIEESLDDNAKRYQHQGYRRPVQLS